MQQQAESTDFCQPSETADPNCRPSRTQGTTHSKRRDTRANQETSFRQSQRRDEFNDLEKFTKLRDCHSDRFRNCSIRDEHRTLCRLLHIQNEETREQIKRQAFANDNQGTNAKNSEKQCKLKHSHTSTNFCQLNRSSSTEEAKQPQ